MSEIAARLGVTVSTSSGAVERLVELGLLARSDDPNNRRQVRVSITEMGSTTLGQLRELSGRHLRTMLEGCSDADLDVVERAIRIMTGALSEAIPPTTDTQVQPADSPATTPVESRGS
jgi:DNA-binding MarR family transcriptional regulator